MYMWKLRGQLSGVVSSYHIQQNTGHQAWWQVPHWLSHLTGPLGTYTIKSGKILVTVQVGVKGTWQFFFFTFSQSFIRF